MGEERESEMIEKASAMGENECVCVREKVGVERNMGKGD